MIRVAIVGMPQSGKSTFGSYLAEYLGTKAVDTSEWLVEVETERQKALHGDDPKSICLGCGKDTKAGCDCPAGVGLRKGWDHQRDRPSRELLIALGDAVCKGRPSFLIDRALEGGNIVVGIRRVEEFESLPQDVYTVMVQRPGFDKADNFSVPEESAAEVIINDGDLDGLKAKAEDLANRLAQMDHPLVERWIKVLEKAKGVPREKWPEVAKRLDDALRERQRKKTFDIGRFVRHTVAGIFKQYREEE